VALATTSEEAIRSKSSTASIGFTCSGAIIPKSPCGRYGVFTP
jgi:hypothetical protein